jgi:hypothetical protein
MLRSVDHVRLPPDLLSGCVALRRCPEARRNSVRSQDEARRCQDRASARNKGGCYGSSRDFANTALALGMVLLSFVPPASAAPREDVGAATLAGGAPLVKTIPTRLLPYYAQDAVLWGTPSPTLRADRAALRDYFLTAFKVLPGLKVSFGDQLIRVYGDTAVNTGYYISVAFLSGRGLYAKGEITERSLK